MHCIDYNITNGSKRFASQEDNGLNTYSLNTNVERNMGLWLQVYAFMHAELIVIFYHRSLSKSPQLLYLRRLKITKPYFTLCIFSLKSVLFFLRAGNFYYRLNQFMLHSLSHYLQQKFRQSIFSILTGIINKLLSFSHVLIW